MVCRHEVCLCGPALSGGDKSDGKTGRTKFDGVNVQVVQTVQRGAVDCNLRRPHVLGWGKPCKLFS